MIKSMTGYGFADAQTSAGRFIVEARAVNHRFSEIAVRLPRDLAGLEEKVRSYVQSRVVRGRVEVVIMREERGTRLKTVRPDPALARAYAQALKELAHGLGVPDEVTLSQVTAFPDVIRVEEPGEDVEGLWPNLEEAVTAAVTALVRMREAEGRRLAEDMTARLTRIEQFIRTIEPRSRAAVADSATRLRQRITEMLGEVPVDENRLATEIVVFADRTDVSEEVTRLHSHIAQFRGDLADAAGPVGRKLEFVLQEMGRETNTIGSKANDLDISRAVISIKGELESLREQVQNIE